MKKRNGMVLVWVGVLMCATWPACSFSQDSKAASSKKAKTVPSSKPEEPKFASKKDLADMLDLLRPRLENCQGTFRRDMALQQADYNLALSTRRLKNSDKGVAGLSDYDRLEVKLELMKKKNVEGYDFEKCVASAKITLDSGIRNFVEGFRAPSLQDKAKATLAQWLTALDATGKDNFDQELSKFDTLANALKIDIALQ